MQSKQIPSKGSMAPTCSEDSGGLMSVTCTVTWQPQTGAEGQLLLEEDQVLDGMRPQGSGPGEQG